MHQQKPAITKFAKFRSQALFTSLPPSSVRWAGCSFAGLDFVMGVTGKGEICRLEFARGKKPNAHVLNWKKKWKHTDFVRDDVPIAALVKSITSGKAVKLLMVGTEFQREVWRNLLAIPEGQVVSYAELARRSGRPKAVRAVGTACGANPVPVLVPCHRVLASNGGIGGFGGGLAIKKTLLKGEGVEIKRGQRLEKD